VRPGAAVVRVRDGRRLRLLALRYVVEHERMHCQGYDHPGEDTARRAWEAYKQGRRREQQPPETEGV
jgi:hypothetical protein